jgi:hypothetical protein
MSLRTTLLLIVAAVGVGVVAYINPFSSTEEEAPDPPWFYQVSEDDIMVIDVQHLGDGVRFIRNDEGKWEFEDLPGVAPSHVRWGGMVLMLTGPKTRRLLQEETPGELSEYGLDPPASVVDVTLTGGRRIKVSLGDRTTDGKFHYGQIEGFDQLFLIAAGWGEQLTKLAIERPLPKWFVKRPADEIIEISMIRGENHGGNNSWLQIKRRDDLSWSVQRHGLDLYPVPIDLELFDEIRALMAGPQFEVLDSNVADFTQFGILEDKSTAITLRFEAESQQGTDFDDGVIFRIGDQAPDGTGYYARSEEGEFSQPLLLLDNEWTEAMLALDNEPPYGDDPEEYRKSRKKTATTDG